MISGQLPYVLENEGNYLELYEKIINKVWIMPSEATNSDLQDLLRGMICKKASERYSCDKILRHQWTNSQYPPGKNLNPILAYVEAEERKAKVEKPLYRKGKKESHKKPLQQESRRSPIISYQADLQGCQTTMIPYMSKMFQSEIEQVLAANGSVADYYTGNISSVQKIHVSYVI